MKPLLVNIITVSLLLVSGSAVVAQQKKDGGKYKAESELMRKQVWAWNKPEFKVKEIPAKYANASKVIIAHHTELSADSKSKLFDYGISFTTKLSILEMVRQMIKLNDKSAVEEYSELSFTQLSKKSDLFSNSTSTTFVGVRVLKPNGKIIEINADDIVLTKDEANEKQAKLAIPDLEPGDIIDYFIANDQLFTNDSKVKTYTLPLVDDAPMLHYSFHGQLGKKFALAYRSFNGAPDLKVTKNDNEEIVIDVERKDIDPFESSLWVASALQLPIIRMNISLGLAGRNTQYLGQGKPGEINKNLKSEYVVNNELSNYSQQFYNSYTNKAGRKEFLDIVNDAKKKAKQSGLKFKDMSEEEKAAHLYYTLRFSKLLKFNMDKLERSLESGDYSFNGLAFVLSFTFKAAELDPAILLTSPRHGFRMNEIMSTDDLVSTTYLMGTNKIFTIQSIYDHPFTAPANMEGAKTTQSFEFKKKATVTTGDGISVPESNAGKNAHIEYLKLSVNPENNLSVKRKAVIKGHNKYGTQRQLILYEDYYESERKALGESKSLIETLEDGRKSRKFVDEVKNAFAEARTKQKDAFKEEAETWFEQKVSNLKNYKVDNLGVRHTAPDFVYSSDFDLEGLVKKAGNNLIVEIGKIQGQPLSIKPEQRKRTLDVHMSFPRSIEYHVEFNIPPGYTAEGVEALNKKVSNETGFFTAEATATANTISIKVKKHYLHAYEPVANWNKMLEFLDAADEWTNAKVLLKKKS